jgi:hypothetical protein
MSADAIDPQRYLDELAPHYIIQIPAQSLVVETAEGTYFWNRYYRSKPALFKTRQEAEEVLCREFGGPTLPGGIDKIEILPVFPVVSP